MTVPNVALTVALADRYRIERELGAGGMATVYLAEDLKHGRRVAIKVLRPELAAVIGAERFVREIRTIAALQHPHILGLIDSGEVEGTAWYAMPFVEGESLRDRLTREKQLPIADAVRLAGEVASALDYAHRHGVIHRDIKPENILLHDGSALVADFGIALAVSSASGTRMTETGMSLGTPHYMSPEQAMGEREITARSDVYALGCVTYEMLVGEPPFTGPTAQAIVARMMTEAPRSLAAQRSTVPPAVEDAVMTALAKLPADRFASAAEFAAALRSDTGPRRTTAMPAPARRSARPARIAAAAAILTLVGLAAWGWLRPAQSVLPATRRVDVALPDSAPIEFVGEAPIGVGQTALALSPDGRTLVYVGGGAGRRTRLFVRPLDRFEATPLAGTDGAYGPFFSPDGDWIGFFAENQLRKVSVSGGAVSVLADAPGSTGGAWSEDGRIEFLTAAGADWNEVAAAGGKSRVVSHRHSGALKPLGFLPGGHWLLCTTYVDEGFYILVALATDGRDARVLVRNGAARPWHEGSIVPDDALLGASPQYDRRGSLLYTRADGSLMAVRFDASRLEVQGEPVTVALGLRRESWTGHAQVALAGDGTLAYVTGANSDVGPLAWLDRSGRLDTLPFPVVGSLGTDVSSDGRSLAVAIPAIGGSLELWVYDFASAQRQRVLGGLCASEVRWSADGRTVLACLTGVGLVRLDPARPGRIDTLAPNRVNPSSPSRDGRLLLLGSVDTDSEFVLALDGRSRPTSVPYTTTGPYQPSFSPDGHWVASLGQQNGVFVEPYPVTGEVYRVSGQLEGDVPSWSPDGREIIFPSASQLYAVAVQPGPTFRFGAPRLIAAQRLANISGRPYAMAPDGRRFLIRVPTAEHAARSIHLVLNGGPAAGR